MTRKRSGFRAKNSQSRQVIDVAAYRERRSGRRFDSEYSGWSWATRPKDQAISLRSVPTGPTGVTGSTGPS